LESALLNFVRIQSGSAQHVAGKVQLMSVRVEVAVAMSNCYADVSD
jgi:hypothetical protein